MDIARLRNGAIVAFFVAMALLLGGGYFAVDHVPPIPSEVHGPNGLLTTRAQILRGQDVYQRYGLMDHGSIWGHGSLRGPDFSARTLHNVGKWLRDFHGDKQQPGSRYEDLSQSTQAAIDGLVIQEMRQNRYDPEHDILRLTEAQAYAFEQNRKFWEGEMGKGNPRYGFLPNTVPTAQEREALADFFFWTAWAAGTNRPGVNYSYTNNWPPDRTVGNVPMPAAFVWTIASLLALFALFGLVVYVIHRYEFFYGEARAVEAAERLSKLPLTPSQRAAAKFFLVAGLLFMIQILQGGLLAHYTVHPGQFYINFIVTLIPYSVAKTWHLQLAILWIAVSWVGTAIYLAPLVAGREPRNQALLVNLLFVAVLLVAGGSLLGQWVSIKGGWGEWWFWLGHQGWEYLELGRLWQILLFVGLIFWLLIVYRTLVPALYRPASSINPASKEDEEQTHRRSLLWFYVLSAILVVAFFGFGLFYGRGTHLTIADYWRWFVVHIWVESMFEFFGVAVIALFLVHLGLVTAKSALRVAYLTAILVFLSGIPGTAHHYFWYGGPSFWLAIGGVFSSLEPVPLMVLVVRAWMEYKSIRDAGHRFPYRWPLYFITASSVWNFVGAGIFGFMINLPLVNYYEHGTYLTSNHGHTALFGVYGMLAIALVLFSWRGLVPDSHWNDRLLAVSFWGLNIGLALMSLTGLLPIGLYQAWFAFEHGTWWARSAEFYELPVIQRLGNFRIVPDLILIVIGALPLLYFLVTTFPRLRPIEKREETI